MTAKKSVVDAKIPPEIKAKIIRGLISRGEYGSARAQLILEKRMREGLSEELAELWETVNKYAIPNSIRKMRECLEEDRVELAYHEFVVITATYREDDGELPKELRPLRDEIAKRLIGTGNNRLLGNGIALKVDYPDSRFERLTEKWKKQIN